jgi:hypothetical protein
VTADLRVSRSAEVTEVIDDIRSTHDLNSDAGTRVEVTDSAVVVGRHTLVHLKKLFGSVRVQREHLKRY